MKHIVFLVGSYHPYYAAVGVCVGHVAKELEKDNRVTVLCFESRSGQPPIETYGAQTIVRVSTPRMRARIRLEEKSMPVRRFIHRGFYYVKTILSRESVDWPLVEAYVKALKTLGPIDMMVPACNPFETVLAAIRYKQCAPGAEIMPFLFDKFSASRTLHRTQWNRKIKWKRHLALEQEMLEYSRKVLLMDAWRGHLESHFPAYRSKFCMMEHPLVVPVSSDARFDFEKGKIHIVYTGSFHTAVRPPAYTLRLFQRLCERDPSIVLHLCTVGNCEGVVRAFCEKNPGMIHHGSLPKNLASAALLASDFLLSVGNRDVTQVTSKVFEYMSCGKPIIHLYMHRDDSTLPILSQYPLALCLGQEEASFDQNITAIRDFLYENRGKTIPFDTVAKLYHTALPAYSAGVIRDEVRS